MPIILRTRLHAISQPDIRLSIVDKALHITCRGLFVFHLKESDMADIILNKPEAGTQAVFEAARTAE